VTPEHGQVHIVCCHAAEDGVADVRAEHRALRSRDFVDGVSSWKRATLRPVADELALCRVGVEHDRVPEGPARFHGVEDAHLGPHRDDDPGEGRIDFLGACKPVQPLTRKLQRESMRP
jgi:hypothetical protein